MIFDTDVFIWIQRGSASAADALERESGRFISAQTYMELMQGAKNREQQNAARRFLRDFGVRIIPLSAEIGDRAMSLVEQFSLSHDMRAGDAIIAATALEQAQTLCTPNAKRYRQIPLLQVKCLKP